MLRTCELETAGLTRRQVRAMAAAGQLVEVARGLYARSSVDPTEHRTLVEAQRRVPAGVICLLSALRFHGLGTQNPAEIWIAIDVKARKPATSAIPIHIVRFSGRALAFGVQRHVVEGATIRVTTPAKTVADSFKYRNKIGLDVALEALRAYLSRRGRSIGELLEAATVCRVANVMRPYIEALS